ncbi:hypothetical protein ACMA5I_10400 [Paracoccaceae bacterium GXU_MW_L88]
MWWAEPSTDDVYYDFTVPVHHNYLASGIFHHNSGHGKTQCMQYNIVQDIKDGKSVIVIDSQNEMIQKILNMDIDKERIVYVNPEDIEHPIALNLFATGKERFEQYNAQEKEQLRTSIIELYEYVLASIMDTSLSGQQSVIFRYVTRLLLEIPDATLKTFLDVLEQPASAYSEYIDKLDDVAKSFFYNQFDDNEFKRMRKAVIRRLYLILENSTFERMFSQPESTLDLFEEINQGKVILVNTSQAMLKEQGLRTLGRFFIALLAQASAERALSTYKHPTICYIDEAHEYLDKNISVLLAQARKQRIGLFMAHQYLGQASNDVRQALMANTSIKLAGSMSNADARAMASEMNADPKLIQTQAPHHWTLYAKGVTAQAVPVRYPVGYLERQEQRGDFDMLIEHQRLTYGVAPKPKEAPEPEEDTEEWKW